MAQFQDSAGRTWFIRIHTTVVESIKEKLKLNVLDMFSGELQKKLSGDEMLLFQLIWGLIESQAATACVTKEQFSEAMLGGEFDQAADALTEALVDFRRNPDARANLREIHRLSKLADSKAQAIFKTRIQAINIDELAASAIKEAEAEQERKSQAEMKSSEAVTSLPDYAELTPAR